VRKEQSFNYALQAEEAHAAFGGSYLVCYEVGHSTGGVRDSRFRDINVFLSHSVKHVLTAQKTITVEDEESGKETKYDDSLHISTGARSFVPPIAATNLRGTFTLRQLEDAIAIKEYILKGKSPGLGLIIGGVCGLPAASTG
jgi:NAD(P)H-nitrite reductase large subunit